jgi:RNA polymerase sigma factor (sigma-70 family)
MTCPIPPRELGEELHRRLLAGDPTASSEVVHTYLNPVIHALQRQYPAVKDETIFIDKVTDAIFQYVQSPATFDPRRASLSTYLIMVAKGDLLNALERERRRTRRHVPLEKVEVSGLSGNTVGRPEAIEDEIEGAELMRAVLQHFPDPRDRELLQLILDGERETRAYVDVLGIADCDLAEQQTIVKQHKDRIKKRLRRLGVKLRGP